MKYLHVTMPDTSIWAVPVHEIADNRAKYYVSYGYDYQEEYDFATSDNHTILTWATNRMNWDDVAHVARMMEPPLKLTPEDAHEGWIDGQKELVER
jgi:hypothetical protein